MNRPLVPVELLRRLDQRRQAAQAEVDRIRSAITELQADPEQAQQVADRLQVTRQTLMEIAKRQDATADTRSARLPGHPGGLQPIHESLTPPDNDGSELEEDEEDPGDELRLFEVEA